MKGNNLLKYYLMLLEQGADLSDTEFDCREDAIVIRQPIDDEEEDDKYVVLRKECDSELWDEFVKTFKVGG